jgi:V/A-type H+-transporting ATPase subunit F
LDIFPISSKEEGKKIIEELKDYAVVFITEDWMEKLEEELFPLKTATTPAVISIPTHFPSTGYGIKELKKIVERAVGSDILFKG